MDPTQMTPQAMQMVQALQGRQMPQQTDDLGASLGNTGMQDRFAPQPMPDTGVPLGGLGGLRNFGGGATGPDAYQAMMNPPPMVPPPAPIY